MSTLRHRLKSLLAYPIDLLAQLTGRLHRKWLTIEAGKVLRQLQKLGTNVSIGAGRVFLPPSNMEIGDDV
jgi:hypothetical protein